MQCMPLLLRQSLRSSLHLTRTPSGPVRAAQLRPTIPSAFSVPRAPTRNFSVCLQCQFRRQPELYSSPDERKDSVNAQNTAEELKEAPSAREEGSISGDVGSSRATLSQAEIPAEQPETEKPLYEEPTSGSSVHVEGTQSGGLPSSLESRRSQVSKQFTTLMDNLQSNIFVAGQRLNDLTGYSGIEALKKEIQFQESRLRDARAQVKKAKEDYAAAINSRSASQREVNELLQRKHSWSPTDLERFTLLYRNDHANEVLESTTQEALSKAEREAEEAAALLSKGILSRYHEEQVWSDKIRRMSTWGTWGLMGMNILLFLIFQIAVEPWRRKRLVRGFEDKVIEAMEKQKALDQGAPVESASLSADSAAALLPFQANEEPIANAGEIVQPEPSTITTNSTALQSLQSQLSNISSSPTSLAYWQQALHELFSDRHVAISQRDLSTLAVQSAAAGAAVMGLVLALIRH
ncbi:hypothetical protein N7474_001115 [Penicillium riverlandense]|uniref:uncharacterized protein n=1 Tax=Penicillium riverlandense TaxID=1903569 RepID=UPI00254857EA|nr:uncharacterized protein N7474_001115 [Penicillium riverlandense]KAJ5832804.1 hypothetical protein N7474_001115 [Penicillium riverlandense]